MTARELKASIRDGAIQVEPGPFRIPVGMSRAKEVRLRRNYEALTLYLWQAQSVTEIAKKMELSHQRICQMLEMAIKYAIETGMIRRAQTIAK